MAPSWVQTIPPPVSALANSLALPPSVFLLAQNRATISVPHAMDSALHKLSDNKPIARKLTLRFLLFALILIALHFLYVLHDESPSSYRVSHEIASVIDGLPPLSTSYISEALKPRYNFKTYEQYVQLQLKKTMNPKLRKLWTSKDWRRKVDVFSRVFQDLMKQNLLKPGDKALCIAARVGQEVLALKEIGVDDSVGIDLVPSPPLVLKGDMHRLPFERDTFDFEFSNAFDHALFPAIFASEVERTLKPGGIAVLHLALKKRADKYSANDLYSIDPLLRLFKNFDVVLVKGVDAFGLDSEIVLRKQQTPQDLSVDGGNVKCSVSNLKQKIINSAEPLIVVEPWKPWITLKENAKGIKYLPSFTDITQHRRFVYVDVGARSYSSSIGSWFIKKYPKQNQDFFVYAVEADESFARDYVKRKNVQLLPYAAWVRNESLVFGANAENRAAEGEMGMGRIQARQNQNGALGVSSGQEFKTVQGFDFADWLKKTVSLDDFVVLKMDIEGTEFDLLPRMFETGAICLVDELFLECHYNRWQRTSPNRTSKYKRTFSECLSLFEALRSNGVLVHQWW